jgi:hypothetical protein
MKQYPRWPGNGLQRDGSGNAPHLDLPIGSGAKSFGPAAPVVVGEDVQHAAVRGGLARRSGDREDADPVHEPLVRLSLTDSSTGIQSISRPSTTDRSMR